MSIRFPAIAGALAGAAFFLSAASGASASNLIVSGDEWQVSLGAYAGGNAASTQALVADMAGRFGGSNYLVLTGGNYVGGGQLTSFVSQLGALGKTVTLSGALPTLPTLATYDAVFHFGQGLSLAERNEIGTFVTGGGDAYISLGGGNYGGPGDEAAAWNPLLNTFGLNAGSSWFTAAAPVVATTTTAPVGVGSLYWNYGQTIDASGPGGASYVRGTFANGFTNAGLLGIWTTPGGVPEPASWGMLLLGFAGLGGVLRARRTLPAAN